MPIFYLLILLFTSQWSSAQVDSLPKVDSSVSLIPKPGILVPDTQTICTLHYCEKGIASYYGKQFHGRTTSSGERFDMFKNTAAHKTLPLGTFVVVTNLSNHKSVVVKINDRMPLWNKREIDLAQGPAQQLGYISAGLTHVQIEIYKPKLTYK